MRILFTVTRAFKPYAAGVQRTTFKLSKFFTDQGLEVAYFSTENRGHDPVEYGCLFFPPDENGLKEKKNVAYLEEILQSWKPDIVINQMPYDRTLRQTLFLNKKSLQYALLGCLRNSLYNFLSNVRHKTKQGLPKWAFSLIDNKPGLFLIKLLHIIKHRRDLQAILEKHDYFVLLTPPNKSELRYFVGEYLLEKTVVIPNSIPQVFSDCIDGKKKKILYVGSLNVTQKRTDLLLNFWKRVYHELPDWEFFIVGEGTQRDIIKSEIQNEGLPRVYLEGHQKPEKYYKEASVFIMTSAYEGFPNTILEAHSYGCPVLAFNSYAALEWIVHDGSDALLSPPFDTEDMAANFIQIARNEQRLKSMQHAAIENARRFTIDRVGQQWIHLFNELRSQKA